MINKYGSQREQLIINGAGTGRQQKKKSITSAEFFYLLGCVSIPVKCINWQCANFHVNLYEKLTVGESSKRTFEIIIDA